MQFDDEGTLVNELRIGAWVKREGAFRRHVDEDGFAWWTGPRWHVVESVVAGAAVTRCGRRMEALTGSGPLEVRDTQPLTRMIGQPQNCRVCDRAPTFDNDPLPEDDGSTQGETVP